MHLVGVVRSVSQCVSRSDNVAGGNGEQYPYIIPTFSHLHKLFQALESRVSSKPVSRQGKFASYLNCWITNIPPHATPKKRVANGDELAPTVATHEHIHKYIFHRLTHIKLSGFRQRVNQCAQANRIARTCSNGYMHRDETRDRERKEGNSIFLEPVCQHCFVVRWTNCTRDGYIIYQCICYIVYPCLRIALRRKFNDQMLNVSGELVRTQYGCASDRREGGGVLYPCISIALWISICACI